MLIYKYIINIDLENKNMYVCLPVGAEAISMIYEDMDKAYVYALVDPLEKRKERREILWIGTGWELERDKVNKIKSTYQFLGTYTWNDLVYHFWIEPETWDLNRIFIDPIELDQPAEENV